MVHKELKRLRKINNFTLKELSSRVGYGTGNLSSYENGKLKARDATLMRILTRGYNMSKEEAKARIAMWRRNELLSKYKVLASDVEGYNKIKVVELKKVMAYLKKQGVSQKVIEGLYNI